MKKKLLVFVVVLIAAGLFAGCATTGNPAWEYYARGNEAYGEKDWDRAIAWYTRAIGENSSNIESAYIWRGHAYEKKGEIEKAIADFSEAIRINPDETATYHSRAWMFLLTGQPEKARDDFNEILRIDPDNFSAKAGQHSHLRVPTAAFKAYYAGAQAANVSQDKEDPKLDEAIEYFREAINLSPGYSAAYNSLAGAYEKKGMYDEAEANVWEALNFASSDTEKVLIYNNLGSFYHSRREDSRRALDFHKMALQIGSDTAYTKARLGRTLAVLLAYVGDGPVPEYVTKVSLGKYVVLEKIDGESPKSLSFYGSGFLLPGRHSIEVSYSSDLNKSIGSVTLEGYLRGGTSYIVTGGRAPSKMIKNLLVPSNKIEFEIKPE
jgi:tetratricopeptide (TPR) repeat protein